MRSSSISASVRSTDRIFFIVSIVLIAALWLSTRPYQGIIDDSRFYTVQVLNALWPSRFTNDLYFQYGSQGEFTIFTWIYAPFISIFGLSCGNIILTLLSQALAVIGAGFFSYALYKSWRLTFASLATLTVLSSSAFLTAYGEPFLTPRIMAEGFTFFGLGCMLNRRSFFALVIFLISSLIHPLVTFPGIAVFFLYESIRQPKVWILAILGGVIFLGLAFWGVQPFGRFLIRFDPTWLRIAQIRSFYCFISLWNLQLWTLMFNSISTSLFTMIYLTAQERKILVISFVVTIFGLVVTYIGGDLFHDVLIVDVQLWRGVWLLNAVTVLFLGKVLTSFKKNGINRATYFVFSALFITLFLAKFFAALILFVTPIAVLGIGVHIAESRAKGQITVIGKRLIAVYLSIIFAFSILVLKFSLVSLFASSRTFVHFLTGFLVVVFSSWLVFGLCRHASVRVSRLVICASVILLLTSVVNWDQRTPWTKFVDATTPPPASLVAALPKKGTVYWEHDVAASWFLLKRASPFSCAQGTGVIFSRGTAIAYQARYQIFTQIGMLGFKSNQLCRMPKLFSPSVATFKNLAAVCQNQPHLGALVLTTHTPGVPAYIWTSPVTFQTVTNIGRKQVSIKIDKFYIYRCDEFLSRPAS
ncbi:hypothetical protein [Acidocella sp.]|uniref:hypothetical protein n=1 Tax=Acidocella sp. TaxID=50710 RepID=UPI002626EBC6|nr:hypothetical protein [Acidocella sp.]